jgi:transcriptional regulator NrdR family protein
MARCPYCQETATEVMREERLNEYESNIEILFQCEKCKKPSVAIMKVDEWRNKDGEEIK